ncbi:hypothetical protein WK66_07220 [Burkholderia ubonensis]|uniref:K(+)-transporting ATPase subunit F n=1 Tax=Burkholderia ubonensis TaxID=101571 RepID=UPI000752262F|nr:K(+)-transporting ATPase subunit F [Burkholderia ubonensis]KVU29495.1 hypothetical protein WK66_07220 [Burkholderia ubonensis]KVU39762.1 hypothetical protein WK69_25465 [Burkholderia ubonensis]KVU83585.1 hypothetical protein WK75_29450 [Burkholderia ubonensis]
MAVVRPDAPPQRRGPAISTSAAGFPGKQDKKGKAMLWISGGISVALFIYLFHALIKPERY